MSDVGHTIAGGSANQHTPNTVTCSWLNPQGVKKVVTVGGSVIQTHLQSCQLLCLYHEGVRSRQSVPKTQPKRRFKRNGKFCLCSQPFRETKRLPILLCSTVREQSCQFALLNRKGVEPSNTFGSPFVPNFYESIENPGLTWKLVLTSSQRGFRTTPCCLI